MKYADTNRHCSEGRTGLKNAKLIFSLFLLLLSFNLNLFAQIELNGFCRTEYIKTGGNVTSLNLQKINDDKLPDILLFNPAKREVTEIITEENDYSDPVNKFSFYPISDIREFDSVKNPSTFLVISRNEKRCAEISFRKNGSIKLLDELKFDTFPEVLETAEVSGDSLVEGFICGTSFDGISMISLAKNKLTAKKIVTKRLFSDIAVADLDFDGFPEIAAIDFINNSINMFYNDGTGNFSELRTIETDKTPLKLKLTDFNRDGYVDLIITTDSVFEISEGDSVSSFDEFRKIETGLKPGKFIINDFNNDGKNDFAVLETGSGNLKILFNQGNNFKSFPKIYLATHWN